MIIKSFEGLRGTCALIVALAHFGVVICQTHFFTRPALAVEVFFLISGFVLAKAYSEKVMGGNFSFKHYFLRRLFRLYPLHLFCLLALLALYAFATVHSNYYESGIWSIDNFPIIDDHRNYKDGYYYTFLINLFFLQGTGLNISDATWVYPSWSVGAEFFVCLLLFPLYKYMSTISRLIVVACLFIGSYFILIINVNNLGGHSSNLYGFLSLGLLRVTGGFFLGVVLFEIKKVLSIETNNLIFQLMDILLVVMLISFIGFLKFPYIDYYAILLITPLVFIFSYENSFFANVFSNKLMCWLGELSYSIYLNHVFVIGCFQYLSIKDYLVQSFGNFVGLLLCTVAYIISLITMSFYTHKYIEKPLRTSLYRTLDSESK